MLPGNTPEDARMEALVDAIDTAICDAGVSQEFVESREYEHVLENLLKVVDDAYAQGRADAMAEQAMVDELRARTEDRGRGP